MKRLLSLLLCLSMLLTVAPVNVVFAEDTASRAAVTLSAPTGLRADEAEVTFVGLQLRWNAVSGATGYEVQYRPASTSAWTDWGAATSATCYVGNLTCGTEYYFRVRAVADDGTTVSYSQYSSIFRQTVRPAKPVITAQQHSVTSIKLTWNVVGGAQGYNIYRSENGGAFTLLKTFTGYTVYDYVDSGLTVGNTYMYEICGWRDMNGVRVEGLSTLSDEIKILPLAPENVKTAVASASGVKVTWNAVSGATGYNVYRANSFGGSYTCIASGVTGVSYTDSGLLTGATYYYYVTSVVGGAESNPSTTVSSTPQLLAPANFKVASTTNSSVKVSWSSVPLASGYRLYYSTEADGDGKMQNASCIELTDSDVSYTFTGLNPSEKYYFQIFAYVTLQMSSGTQDEMVSDGSMVITAYTNPTTPTGLTAEVVDYDTIHLTWTDIGEAVAGYEVYRSTDNVNFILLSNLGNAYELTNVPVTCGTAYYYRIRAYTMVDSTKVYSQYSSVVNARPVPNAPQNLYANGTDGSSIYVSWTGESGSGDPINGATGYYVYYRTKGENDFILGADVDGGSVLNTVLTNMPTGAEIEIRVCAYRKVGNYKVAGKYSDIVTATAKPLPPTGVTATSLNETSLRVTWQASKGADGYDLYMYCEPVVHAEPKGVTTVSRAVVDLASMDFVISTAETSHTVTGLVPGYVYTFRVVPFVEGASGTVTGEPSACSADAVPRPNTPAGFTGTALATYTAKLSWNATNFAVTNLRGYEISYSTDGAQTWTALIDVNDPATVIYTHENREEAKTYMYRIRSYVYSDGKKIYSAYSSAISVAPKPATATGLWTSSNATNSIEIYFTSPDTAVKYQLFRSTSPNSGFTRIAVIPEGQMYWNDETVQPGVTYYYRVRGMLWISDAVNYFGDYSATVSAVSRPAKPTNLKAVSNGVNVAWVNWTQVAGVTGYELYRSQSENSGYTMVRSVTAAYNGSNDSGLTTGQTYYYKVRSYVIAGGKTIYSEYSDFFKYVCMPKSPANFKVASTTYNSATLSWTAVSGASGYTVKAQYNDYEGDAQTVTKTTAGTTTSVTFSDLPIGATVTFTIVTNVTVGDSVVSSTPASTVTTEIMPAKVTGLVANSVSSTSTTLSWNAVSGALYYIIESSDDGVAWTQKATEIKATNYTDSTALAAGDIRYYRVRAVNAKPDGTEVKGPFSDKAKVVSVPAAPTGLTVTNNPSHFNLLSLKWTATNGATGYQVYRSTNASSGFALVATTTSPVYNDWGAMCGTTYYYKVRSYVESSGTKNYSAFTGAASGKSTPGQTAGLTVSAASTTSAKLTWTATAGATGYQVWYKADTATSWTNAGTTTALTKTITGLAVGATYEFRVRAYRAVKGANVFGDLSAIATLSQKPNVPQKVAAASVNSNAIKVTWNAVAGAKGYEVHIATDANPSYVLKATVTTNAATLTGLEIGVKVYVKVRAYGVKSNGTKEYSDFAAVVEGTPRPVAPTLKIASYNTSGVTLGWNAITDATGYVIYRKMSASADFAELTRVSGSNITSYRDNGVSAGQTPYYSIRAIGQTVSAPVTEVLSGYSNVVYQKLTPKAPTAKIWSGGPTTIKLAWDDVGADAYWVQRSTSKTGTYTKLGSTTGTSWTDSTAVTGTTYYYKVFSQVGSQYVASAVVSGKALPAQVTNVKATSAAYNGAKVTWTKVPGATGYEIYARVGSSSASRKLFRTVNDGNTESIHIWGLTTGVACYVEVRALAGKAAGGFSAQAKVTPIPATPGGVSATGGPGKKVYVKWNKVEGATGYLVLRSTDGTNFSTVGNVTGTSLTLNNQNPGVKFYYKVRAYRTVNGKNVYGYFSSVVNATPEP